MKKHHDILIVGSGPIGITAARRLAERGLRVTVIEAGSAITDPPGDACVTFKPVVKRVDLNRELRWLGRLIVPGLFDGEHSLIHLPGKQTRVAL